MNARRHMIFGAVVIVITFGACLWVVGRWQASVDARDAGRLARIRAAEQQVLDSQQLVIVERIKQAGLEQRVKEAASQNALYAEQIATMKAALPSARPTVHLEHDTGTVQTSGAPIIDCTEALQKAGGKSTGEEKISSGVEKLLVQCPNPEMGAHLTLDGWTTDAGTQFPTGVNELRWRWPGGKEWTRVSLLLDKSNTSMLGVRPDEKPQPILRGWGVGGSLSCARSGCGLGPHIEAAPRRWTTRKGREIELHGSGSLTVLGEVIGTVNASVRF